MVGTRVRFAWTAGLAVSSAFAACSSDPTEPSGAPTFDPSSAALADAQRRVDHAQARFGVSLHDAGSNDRPSAHVALPSHASGEFALANAQADFTVRVEALSLANASGVRANETATIYPSAAPGGGDVFVRVHPWGFEDFVTMLRKPQDERLSYRIHLPTGAGLRVVEGLIEVVDSSGTPRVRMKRPFALRPGGERIGLRADVLQCDVDRSPAAPWGRAIVTPGADSCVVEVAWSGLEYPLLIDPAWSTTGSMSEARAEHVAERNGGQLVLVGSGAGSGPLTFDLYDPVTGTFAATGSISHARKIPIAAPLAAGRVLLASGFWSGAPQTTSEVYDPATGTWSLAGDMLYEHTDQSRRAVLQNGRVLVVGGPVAGTEVFEPATQTWSAAAPMSQARLAPFVATLLDGRVLVAGGNSTSNVMLKTAEVYDPAANSWTATTSMHAARRSGVTVRLADGRVLVSGGFTYAAEVYDPVTAAWTQVPNALSNSNGHGGLLSNGRSIVAGGTPGPTGASQLFDPDTNTWLEGGNMDTPRELGTGTVLSDGGFLVTGGYWQSGAVSTDAADVFRLQPPGAVCTRPGECESGFCVAGLCCDTTCTDPCHSCKGADQQGGVDGTCGPVTAGTDPFNDCSDDGSPSCENNGLCDGAGGCQKYPISPGCTPRGCTSGAQCTSGHCEDGICCDTACGTCKACTAAKKGSGVDGTCEPVPADVDPDGECEVGPGYPASCLADGQCDGVGACRVFAKQTVSCGDTQCISGNAVGLLCNGAGTCGQATVSCDPYLCANGACLSSCTDSNDCASGRWCTPLHTCEAKAVVGTACSSGAGCVTGYCADGVCCDTPCTGQCEACNVAPNIGSCVPAFGSPVAPRPACAGLDQECAGACNGVDRSACSFPGIALSCGTPTCATGVARASHCDGQGACVAGDDQPCGAYACGTASCLTTCDGPSDCAQGYGCTPEGVCVPGGGSPNGTTCEAGAECQSGFCADGVCCDSACNGQCEACNVDPNVGSCSPVTGSPVGDRTPCVDSDADCAGACDGVNRVACGYPGADTSCGTPACTGGVARGSHCNGKGLCVPADDNPCGAYACGDTRCKTSCAGQEDCAAGYTCTEAGTCAPGSSCSDDLTRTIGVTGEFACAPFLCDPSTGRCHVICTTTKDCATGYVCDPGSKACIPGAQGDAPEEDEGCGCRVAGRSGPSPHMWLVVGLAALAARRRRSRSSFLP
jgi:MYXO-CTERM domain-containing protein